ncbi:hypothetical protein Q1695_012133 [Nippostrongylus brasiliensis]|nr:hypothetical protein Q1695_012133 [Nippostrongylus brasiliensis]
MLRRKGQWGTLIAQVVRFRDVDVFGDVRYQHSRCGDDLVEVPRLREHVQSSCSTNRVAAVRFKKVERSGYMGMGCGL